MLNEVAAGAADEAHALNVDQYLEEWFAGKRALRPSTRASYRHHLTYYLIPQLGHYRLRELRPRHIDTLLDSIAVRGTRKELSPATQRRVYATLRTALNAAVRRRLVPYNPALAVELPAEHRTATVVWTADQASHFLRFTTEDRLHPVFHLVLVTGLRRGEVTGLRWQDVDLDLGLLRIRQQLVQVGGAIHVGPPKTKAGFRTIALDAGTVLVLRGHAAAQNAEREAWGPAWQSSGHVFCRENGAPLMPGLMTRRFRTLVGQAGLPPITFHALRHTSASLAPWVPVSR